MVEIKPENLNLREELQTKADKNLSLCYQCKKCSAGCPVAHAMDYTPTQIIHMIHLGLKDLVLRSRTPWLCAACQTCITRCPNDIDIPKLMDAVKILAIKEGIKPPVPYVYSFYRSALNTVKFFGRTYDIGLIMGFNLSTRQFFRDMALGLKMFKKGKLKVMPDITLKGISALRKIFSHVKELETRRKSK